MLIAATSFKTSDYGAMVEDVRPDCPGLERVVYVDTDDWAELVASGADVPDGAVAERMARLAPDDPINIQYTSGTTGYPKGATLSHRNILNNGYLTTELINLTADDRLCIPVPFYHCFGMVMGNLGCTSHGDDDGHPRAGLRPRDHAAHPGRGALHRGLRRADDVHRDAEPPDLRRPRPLLAAHRHHGRLDLSGRGDAALRRRHAHGRGLDRLRHDRDLAGLLPDPGRRRPRAAHRRRSAGSTRTSRSRSSTRSPGRPSSAGRPASSAPAATR